MDREVVVRGEGQARSMPDRAVLRVSVTGEGATRDAAYQLAAADARTVDEVLDRWSAALDRVGHAALVVQPKSRWRKGESVRTGWRAARLTAVEVRDFAGLGDLIAELVTAGGEIAGPGWELDPQNPVYGTARRLAAADARSRADDYARALGVAAVEVAWIAEPGLRSGDDHGHRGFALAAAGGAMAEEAEVIDLTPAELTVHAAVEVGFRLSAPGDPPA